MNHRSLRSALLIKCTSRDFGTRLRDPLPWRTFSLPDRPNSRLVQVEHPRLVDSQANAGGQAGDGVVAGGRHELAADHNVLAPPGEQQSSVRGARNAVRTAYERASHPKPNPACPPGAAVINYSA